MRNFSKVLLKRSNLLLLTVFIVAAIVRFYNFPNRVTFWSEQARSLIVSAGYLQKPSLLGQEYFRTDVNGHTIFSGALFNYSLVPLLFIGNWDPIQITVFFTLLSIITGLVVYLCVKKMFGQRIALISSIFFLFNDFMIYHSLFIWNYNYLPLIGILVFYFSWLNLKKRKWSYLFILGIISGIGISIQLLFVLFAFLVIIINLWKSKSRFADFILFGTGIILGNLPMFLFDIRHNFYETATIIQYFIDTVRGKSDAGLSYYYFLPLWPTLSIAGAYIFVKILKYNKFIGIILMAGYLFLNLTSPRVNFTRPAGMPEGLKVADIDYASRAIAKDVNGDFNISEVLDFDKRAYVFRYYLQYKYGKIPDDVTAYPNAKLLYVLAPLNYDFAQGTVWEIRSGGKYKINLLTEAGSGYGIYKLFHELK